jgi:hypothetical protein
MKEIKIILATVLATLLIYACTNSTVETNNSKDSTEISCDTSFCVDTAHCEKVCTEVDSLK